MKSNAIVIFTKLPIKGFAKTRLGTTLTAEEIQQFQIAMMKDVRSSCVSIDADLYVYYYDGEKNEEELSPEMQALMENIFPKNWTFERQYGENTGERMANAFLSIFRKRYQSCVMIMSDVPELRYYQVQDAFEKLVPDMFKEEEPLDQAFGLTSAPEDQLADVVIGPAGDEYYLMGVTAKVPFDAVEEMTSVPIHHMQNALSHVKKVAEQRDLTVDYVDERPLIRISEDVENFNKRMHQPEYGFLAYKFIGKCLCEWAQEDPESLARPTERSDAKAGILKRILGGLGRGN